MLKSFRMKLLAAGAFAVLALGGIAAWAQGTSTSPILNDWLIAISPNEQNQASDIGTATTSDLVAIIDVSATPDGITYGDGANILEMIGTTASAAELTYLDITTLGTGAASKAVVLDASGDYTYPATGTIIYPSSATLTLQSGSTFNVAGTFQIAASAVTATAAELNYNDITALGTGAASKAVVLDGSGDYTYPSTGTIVYPSSATLTLQSGSTLTLQGTNTLESAITGTGNSTDVTLSVPTNGGDAAAVNQFVGVPKMALVSTGAGVNGTTNTVVSFIDDSPAGEWTATANITATTDSTNYRVGTGSLQLVVGATPAAGNGADNPLTAGNQDWTADESVGVWQRCTATTTAGDWVIEITDSVAGVTTVDFPALASADVWTWLEIDISGVADASKDVVTDLAIDLSTAGATSMASQTCEFDFMAKWDGADEEALGQDIYQDGLIGMFAIATATGGNRTPTVLVAHTDYFVHYEAGNDFLVAITDQSANSLWGFAALE